MKWKKDNLLVKLFKTFKLLILWGFLGFFFHSCDFLTQKNLLTFYYQYENTCSNAKIKKLINLFEKSSDIKINAIAYFSDELHKILKDKNINCDLIEIDYTEIFNEENKSYLIRLDSLLNSKKIVDNLYFPWLKNQYYVFNYKNTFKNNHKFFLPLTDDSKKYIKSISTNHEKKIIGIPIDDNQKTIQFLLYITHLYNSSIFLKFDSITFTTPPMIKMFQDLHYISQYVYLGTQNEIEKSFQEGNLEYCFGDNYLKNSLNKNPNFEIHSIMNKFNKNYVYHKSFLAIPYKSKNLKKSLNFLKYLTSDSNQKKVNVNISEIKNNYDKDLNYTLQLFDNKYIYEINQCLLSILFEQDSLQYVLTKTEQKINKMLKFKKHRNYK